VKHVLALDVGSSSVRALVYDERGEELEGASVQTEYERGEQRGAVELASDELVEATKATIERARRDSGELAGVGASCFWHSLLAVDRRGRAISPLLTWRDTRSAPQAEQLAGRLDAEAVHARTGCVLHTSYWPAKLAWLAVERPDVFRQAEHFLSFADYLYLRLLGDSHTSLSMASGTGLLDVNAKCWDEELLDVLGLAPERLPEISDEPVGGDEAWYPALGDGAASNLGAGCVSRDRAALMIGTSGAYRTAYLADRAEPRRGLFCYRLDERRFVEGGSVSDGGNLYAWLEGTLSLSDTSGMAELEPDGHGLTFLPLLGGERSPGWHPRARGAVAGLTFATTALDILQAALEGAAYRIAEIADLMPEVREVVGTGHGLLANADWMQIFADVLGRSITASAVAEGSARGAAVAALERLGAEPGPAPLGRLYEPREERHRVYTLARERQRQLYDALT
jgi:gluconokinase